MSLIDFIYRLNKERLADANRGLAFASKAEALADLNRTRASIMRMRRK